MGAKGDGGKGDTKQAARWCEDGVVHLEQAIKLDPKLADAYALQAGLMGMQISLDPGRAIALGSQIQEAFKRSEAIAPDNPRLALLRGISAYHMPRFFGGGPEKALEWFARAQKHYATETPSVEAIDWGHDESYAWAGRAEAQLGKKDEARALYQKALAINPENTWVAKSLLPQLDKKAKS
jgi:tetratricopeptide (TPR) repeat protein